jgi:hypothetical protein
MSRRDVESTPHPARLHDAIEPHRLAHTLQRLRAKILEDKDARHQALGRSRDDYRVGVGGALHARRHVRGLAEHFPAVGDDDRACMHPHAHVETHARVPGDLHVDRTHRIHDRQARPDGALRVVLARIGPPEIDELAVTQLFRHMAAPPLDGGARSPLVLSDDVPPLLGVELQRESRRADEIAEEHGELAALARRVCGVGLTRWREGAGRRRHG